MKVSWVIECGSEELDDIWEHTLHDCRYNSVVFAHSINFITFKVFYIKPEYQVTLAASSRSTAKIFLQATRNENLIRFLLLTYSWLQRWRVGFPVALVEFLFLKVERLWSFMSQSYTNYSTIIAICSSNQHPASNYHSNRMNDNYHYLSYHKTTQ